MRDNLAGKRGDRAAVRAEDAALDLDARDELLHQHLLVVAEGELHRRRELFLRPHLRNPDRRAEPGRLDEDGVPERVPDLVALAEGDVPRHRDLGVAHDRLELVLVHRERRAEHTGADVGDAGQLEEPLHGAVLAEGAVQDRDDDVDARKRRGDTLGWDRQGLDRGAPVALVELARGAGVERPRLARLELPFPVAVDLDGDRLVAIRVERLQHGTRRGHRDLVLAGAAAHNHCYTYLLTHRLHGTAVVVPV